jgi:hypothetical protein
VGQAMIFDVQCGFEKSVVEEKDMTILAGKLKQ